MTDQTTHDATDEERRIARDWAEHIINTPDTSLPMEAAAARVILHAIPAPPRPTLADMPEEERPACRRMQCDAGPAGRRGVITNAEDWHVYVVDKETGKHSTYSPDLVIPRPDLPRMEWPGDTPNTGPTVTFSMPAPTAPAPALPEGWRLADHVTHGRVIVTAPPNSVGHVYFTAPSAGRMGYGCHWCEPDQLTYVDQEADQ